MEVEEIRPDVVSVAIEINKNLQLRKINQREPLVKIIEEMCKDYELENDRNYSLQFDKHPVLGYNFISEENRHEIKDGSVCKLVYSPSYMVQKILAKMVSPSSEENIVSLQQVLSFVNDKVFIEKFVEGNGITILVTILQGNSLSYDATGYAFKCLSKLLQKGFVPIKSIKDRILDKVINNIIITNEKCSSRTQESCLLIANFLMEKHASEFPEIFRAISIENIIPYLQNEDFLVQQTALVFINSIFNVANTLQRKLLIKSYAKNIRKILYNNVILSPNLVTERMEYQLAMFQARYVSRLRRKAESPVDLKDNIVKKRISLLSEYSFKDGDDDELSKRRNTFTELSVTSVLSEYVIPPQMEASETPPSILVLDCMTHFIKMYQQNYTDAVLAHSMTTVGSEYSFVQLCTQLITLLTDCLLIVSTEDSKEAHPYYPVLFSGDRVFEELFCVIVMVFRKTAEEMRAKKEDYKQVIAVVKKKIQVTLSKKPLNQKDFEDFIYKISYSDISKIWQDEDAIKQSLEMKDKKCLLQKELKPQCLELVKKQRLNALTNGFDVKYYDKPMKIKNKFLCMKYLPSQKIFEFTDKEEGTKKYSIDLHNIKNIIFGIDCTHVKTRGHKLKPEFAFALYLMDMETCFLNLAATCDMELDYIVDGFRMLLGMEMTSPSYEKELQDLLDMHVRLELLDYELLDAYRVELSLDGPPPIPPAPPNYDFFYQ